MTGQDKTLIIGAGPAGASAAIYLARFCHRLTLLDAPEAVHGRTAMATSLRNFLGNTLPTPGPDFLARVETQLANYSIKPVKEKVTKVTLADGQFVATTEPGQSYSGRYLVVAVGVGDTMPEIEGLDPYYDGSIFHCLTCDWYEHRQQKAVVVANDDRGLTTALAIQAMAAPPALAVIPTQASPNYSQALRQRALDQGIRLYGSPLQAVNGTLGHLQSVRLADGTTVPAEVLFTKLGHVRFDQFLDNGGLKPNREPAEDFIEVNFETLESSIPNLFAVGPCNQGPDQAIIAAGQGAMAAMEIHRRILAAAGI